MPALNVAEVDLFGPVPAQTAMGAGKMKGVRKGYAGIPGTGPAGETCGSCQHHAHNPNRTAKVYHKCALNRARWTGGPGSDILVRSPACQKWEKET